jgi:hypothetical protein
MRWLAFLHDSLPFLRRIARASEKCCIRACILALYIGNFGFYYIVFRDVYSIDKKSRFARVSFVILLCATVRAYYPRDPQRLTRTKKMPFAKYGYRYDHLKLEVTFPPKISRPPAVPMLYAAFTGRALIYRWTFIYTVLLSTLYVR